MASNCGRGRASRAGTRVQAGQQASSLCPDHVTKTQALHFLTHKIGIPYLLEPRMRHNTTGNTRVIVETVCGSRSLCYPPRATALFIIILPLKRKLTFATQLGRGHTWAALCVTPCLSWWAGRRDDVGSGYREGTLPVLRASTSPGGLGWDLADFLTEACRPRQVDAAVPPNPPPQDARAFMRPGWRLTFWI